MHTNRTSPLASLGYYGNIGLGDSFRQLRKCQSVAVARKEAMKHPDLLSNVATRPDVHGREIPHD